MNYTSNELDTFQDMMQDAFSTTDMQPASLVDLTASENDDVFYQLDELVSQNKNLTLTFGNNKGMPFYKVMISEDKSRTLYLNKDINRYIYSYLREGKRGNAQELTSVHKNANENYLLRLIKFDRENGAIRYNDKTKEYKAVYQHGTINYGELPYSTEELIAKLTELK